MRLALFSALVVAGGAFAEGQKPATDDGRKAFQGTWKIVETERGGKKIEDATASTVVFDGNKYRILEGEKVVEEGTFDARATKTPNEIEVASTGGMDKGMKWHGIYELEGDTLRAVVGPTDQPRPMKLTEPPKGTRGFTLKRVKPERSDSARSDPLQRVSKEDSLKRVTTNTITRGSARRWRRTLRR